MRNKVLIQAIQQTAPEQALAPGRGLTGTSAAVACHLSPRTPAFCRCSRGSEAMTIFIAHRLSPQRAHAWRVCEHRGGSKGGAKSQLKHRLCKLATIRGVRKTVNSNNVKCCASRRGSHAVGRCASDHASDLNVADVCLRPCSQFGSVNSWALGVRFYARREAWQATEFAVIGLDGRAGT